MAAAIRKVVRNDRIQGTIEKWSGNFGWVVASTPVQHPEAAKHGGKIYLNAQDFEGNAALLKNGAKVNFICYADGNGLGAQQCKVTSTAPQKQQLHLAKPTSTAKTPFKMLPTMAQKAKMVAKPGAKWRQNQEE